MHDRNQPRVPEGYRKGGQWTRGDYGVPSNQTESVDLQGPPPDSLTLADVQYAFLRPTLGIAGALMRRGLFGAPIEEPFQTPIPEPFYTPPPAPLPDANGPPDQDLVDGLTLYNLLSARNRPDSRAVAIFKARAFPGNQEGLELDKILALSRQEVKDACKALDYVQRQASRAIANVAPLRGETPAVYGTRVHYELKMLIEQSGRTDLKPEESIEKSKEDGAPGSIRIDVFERPNRTIVCIYDLKTGRAGLSPARMKEIALTVLTKYKGVRWVIITEVRPTPTPR